MTHTHPHQLTHMSFFFFFFLDPSCHFTCSAYTAVYATIKTGFSDGPREHMLTHMSSAPKTPLTPRRDFRTFRSGSTLANRSSCSLLTAMAWSLEGCPGTCQQYVSNQDSQSCML